MTLMASKTQGDGTGHLPRDTTTSRQLGCQSLPSANGSLAHVAQAD